MLKTFHSSDTLATSSSGMFIFLATYSISWGEDFFSLCGFRQPRLCNSLFTSGSFISRYVAVAPKKARIPSRHFYCPSLSSFFSSLLVDFAIVMSSSESWCDRDTSKCTKSVPCLPCTSSFLRNLKHTNLIMPHISSYSLWILALHSEMISGSPQRTEQNNPGNVAEPSVACLLTPTAGIVLLNAALLGTVDESDFKIWINCIIPVHCSRIRLTLGPTESHRTQMCAGIADIPSLNLIVSLYNLLCVEQSTWIRWTNP